MPTEPISFNDGIVKIYSIDNVLKATLRYRERTVGFSRFYTAMQDGVEINKVLQCPRIDTISTQDFAVPQDGRKYEIKQIQYPESAIPRVMDLSLRDTNMIFGEVEQ